MTAPRRRIWLYPDGEAIEIVLLGTLTDIGKLFARIKTAAEQRPGFRGVEIIGSGATVGVLRMGLTTAARHDDPMAEVLEMLDEMGMLRMFDWARDAPGIGMIGTW